MFSKFPSILLFSVLESVYITRYFIQKRLDSLKTSTWKLYDEKNNEKLLNPETEDNRNSYELIDEKFQKKLKVFEIKIKILKFCASNFILITIMMICLLVINKRIEN